MWQYNEKSLTSVFAVEPHALKSEKKIIPGETREREWDYAEKPELLSCPE